MCTANISQFFCKHGQCLSRFNLLSEQKKNTNDIQDLQNKIMEVLRQEPYMGEKIPVR